MKMKFINPLPFCLICAMTACGGGSSDNATHPVTTTTTGIGSITQRIDTGSVDAFGPSLAMDADGNITVIWQQDNAAHKDIYASRYDVDSGLWSSAQPLNDQNSNTFDPALTVAPDGSLIAVWCQFETAHVSVYASRFDPVIHQWQSAILIGNDSGDAQRPRLVVDKGGNVTVLWQVYDTSSFSYSIYANRWESANLDWIGVQSIETSTESASNPSLVVDDTGNLLVLWQQRIGSNSLVYATRYDVVNGWHVTAQAINNVLTTATLIHPQIALDSAGNAIAIWSNYDGTHYRLFYNHYAPGTGWDVATQTINTGDFDVYNPSLRIDALGHIQAFWQQEDGTGTQIEISSSSFDEVTGNWSSAVAAMTGSTEIFGYALVSILDDALSLFWAGESDIFMQRFDPINGWSSAEVVNSSSGAIDSPLSAVSNVNGASAVVWGEINAANLAEIWVHYNSGTFQ